MEDAFQHGKFKSLKMNVWIQFKRKQMAEEIGNVLTKLRRDPHTLNMFKAAFGTEEITIERIKHWLYVSMITPLKYDQLKEGECFGLQQEVTSFIKPIVHQPS
jgi:hypothetical protein